MGDLPDSDVLWASVICTEVSPAGRRTRHSGPLGFDEHGRPIGSTRFARTRTTALDVMRAAEYHRYRAVVVEFSGRLGVHIDSELHWYVAYMSADWHRCIATSHVWVTSQASALAVGPGAARPWTTSASPLRSAQYGRRSSVGMC